MIARHSAGAERTSVHHRDPDNGAEVRDLRSATGDFLALAADSIREPAESGRLSKLIVERSSARALEEGGFPAWAARREARFLFSQAAASNILLGFIGSASSSGQSSPTIRDRVFNLADFAVAHLQHGRRPDLTVLDRVQSDSEALSSMLSYREAFGGRDRNADRVRPSDWHDFLEETAAAAESADHFVTIGLPLIARALSQVSNPRRGDSIVERLQTAANTIGSRHGFIGYCERLIRIPSLMAELRYWSALDAAVQAIGGPHEKPAAEHFFRARAAADALRSGRGPQIEEMYGLAPAEGSKLP